MEAETAPSKTTPASATAWWPLLAAAFAMVAGYAQRAWAASDAQLIHFFPDDAFYYLQTAANFAAGRGITFDGVNPTNGFHPLFFLLASTLAGLFGKPALLPAVFFVHGLTLCLAAVLIVRLGRRLPVWVGVPAVAALGGYFLLAGIWFSAGMESAMLVLATALVHLTLRTCWQSEFVSARQALALGAAITVFLLSRLDMVLVFAPATLALAIRFAIALGRRQTKTARNLALALAIPALCCAAYVASNVLLFGDPVPVSARAKQLFWCPFEVSWNASTAAGRLPWIVRALAPLAMALLVSGLACLPRRLRSLNPFSRTTQLLAAGTILFYAYLRFHCSNFFSWYFTYPLAFAALAGIELLDAVFATFPTRWRLRPAAARALALSLLAALTAQHVVRLHRVATTTDSIQNRLREVAEQCNRTLPDSAVLATYDAGAIGFFSHHRVINLDGLANSHDYLRNYRQPGKMAEYFATQGVTHFLVRDSLIANWPAVASNRYERAVFFPDPRVSLLAQEEFLRVEIQGHFSVVGYRLYPVADTPY